MRLITFRDQRGDTSTGAIVGERVIDLTQAIAALPPAAVVSLFRRAKAMEARSGGRQNRPATSKSR